MVWMIKCIFPEHKVCVSNLRLNENDVTALPGQSGAHRTLRNNL